MATSRASSKQLARVAPRRYGSEEPRIWTPPKRKLTRKTSLGFSVIDFSETVLKIDLFPWQRWLLIHVLELNPNGTFRFRNVVVLVARQNGKSTLSQVLALWFMYVYGFGLVLGTAQDLDTAEEVWQGAVDLVEETPELDALKERVVMVNGKKSLELVTGERYKVKAASRRAGRGLTGDLILLDELREHQSWDAWGAITKTTMARDDAQVWALSNAGDAASIVLRYLRKMGHLALGDPDGINADDKPTSLIEIPDEDFELDDTDDTLAIFEWSAPPNCAVSDRDGWAWGNPSLGYTITERTIASAMRTDPEWVFRTEVLCQWSSGSMEGPFPAGSWDAGTDEKSAIPEGDRFVFAVDVSWDRSTSHIAAAGYREDGLPHVEIVASRAGTDWVVPWLAERKDTKKLAGVALQAKGAPVSSLMDDLKELKIPVLPIDGGQLGKACGAFYDCVRLSLDSIDDKPLGLRHLPQPILDVAAATAASRPMGEAWVWDRKKSPTDAAPLVAATCALWALNAMPTETESIYEQRGMVVLG